MNSFDFYTRCQIAIFAPVATTAAITLGCVVWATCRPKQERTRKRFVDIHHAKHRGSHGSHVKEGLWAAAPVVLFFLDLVYPLVTRTLCAFFSCRDLGVAGFWLEEDYSVHCFDVVDGKYEYDKAYIAYMPWVAAAAFFYSLGLPALFMFLLKHFMHRGKAGDRVVSKALSWMYDPYRAGKENWLVWPVQVLRNT